MATWDKNIPAQGIVAKNLDNLIRDNNAGIEEILEQDHNALTDGTQDGHHKQVTLNDRSGNATGVASHFTYWNDTGIPKARNGVGTVRRVMLDDDVIPNGTKMWFFANVAPTGWTIVETVTDGLLALHGGAGGTPYETGGIAAPSGTWTQPGHTHTDPATAAVTLSAAQSGLPAHTHNIPTDKLSNDESGSGKVTVGGSATEGSAITIAANSAAVAASAHAHASGGATGSSATANTWRPVAAVGILASKNAYL